MTAGIVTLTLNPTVDLAVSTEQVRPEDKLRCTAPQRDPGGGGVNVARAASRLGAEALAVVPAGGPSGHQLRRLLDAESLPSTPGHSWSPAAACRRTCPRKPGGGS